MLLLAHDDKSVKSNQHVQSEIYEAMNSEVGASLCMN